MNWRRESRSPPCREIQPSRALLRGRAYRLPSMSARESTTSSRWRLGLGVIAAPKRRLICASLRGTKENHPQSTLSLPLHPNPSPPSPQPMFAPTCLFLSDRPTPRRLIRNARCGTPTRWPKWTTKPRQLFGSLACTRPRTCWRTRRSLEVTWCLQTLEVRVRQRDDSSTDF